MSTIEAFIYFTAEGFYLVFHWPVAVVTFIIMSPFYIINFGTWIIASILPSTADNEFDSLIILNGLHTIMGGEGSIQSVIGPSNNASGAGRDQANNL